MPLRTEETCLLSDHRWTLLSPAPLARLTKSAPWDRVACGCHATPPTRSLCPNQRTHDELRAMTSSKQGAPRSERIGVQAGTFQSLTVPDQLPVANISLLGENRTCEIGRSSPICEPRLLYVCTQHNQKRTQMANGWRRSTLTSANAFFRMSMILPRGILLSMRC